MCGRYVSVRASVDLLDEFDAIDSTEELIEPDYNVAPTKPVRAVINRPLRDAEGNASGGPVRQLRVMQWGLVPPWAKDAKIGAKFINARSESVAATAAFRKAYEKRRCLIPADGWYEWQKLEGAGGTRKQAFYMTPPDGHVLAFAGLYEFWRATNDAWLTTCTILTVPSIGAMQEIHDRMPLVLAREAWQGWLDPSVTDPADLLEPWDEARGEHLELRPVGKDVGDHRNNGPDLISPVNPAVDPQALF